MGRRRTEHADAPVDAVLPSSGLLTTNEVARLLSVHPKHVYRLLRRGLPARRVGGDWRYDRDDVLRWATPSRATETVRSEPSPSLPISGSSPMPALLAANGDVLVEILLEHVNERPPLLGFVRADRDRALELLTAGDVMLAGSHGRAFPSALGSLRLARIHLVDREVGLVGPPGKPVATPARLPRLRFAYRPQSAGVVVHLEKVARDEGLDLDKLLLRAVPLGSHREVVFGVLRGQFDVGLATRAWASTLGLAFRPLAVESYGLLLRATDLPRPEVVRLCEVAQSRRFLERIEPIPGYVTSGCGVMRYDPE
ncbi:MAG: helix-turn-helix transcriptional regulator [Deltaproteobacteria bacterium]|nr:helix-turn-helix transcriptional regulator [Nannocystaceae bacterium]